MLVRAPIKMPSGDIERFVASRRGWIDKHLAALKPVREYSPDEEERLRKIAQERLPGLVRRYGDMLGVQPNRLSVTFARKRFGSCSGKGGVSFSFRLFAYPAEAVEYVVAHELAHLKQLNHSPAFYQLLAGVMPDYKQRAKLLRQPPPGVPGNGQAGSP